MSPSDPRLFALEIVTDPEAWITVFDGYDRLAFAPQRGSLTVQLPPGIYTVNCERAGQIRQQNIRHAEPSRLKIDPPQQASAAPLAGASTTHEYYHQTSRKWSVTPTAPVSFPPPPGSGWIFVFIRAWDQHAHMDGTNPGDGFELADALGETLAEFSKPALTAQDRSFGYTALSAPIAPGHYQLRYLADDPWSMPITVFPDRATQVFILFHHKPLIQSVRIFFRRIGVPFDYADADAVDTDLALTGLANGIEAAGRALPRQRERDLLIGKFDDPMLGLIGAHWLLFSPDAQPDYANYVLNNLKNLLPASPDVLALQYLAFRRWPAAFPQPIEPAAFAPMLSAGLRALLSDPDRAVMPDSPLERILLRLRSGSPWVMWRPVPAVTDSIQSADDGWVQRAVLQRLGEPVSEPAPELGPIERAASDLHLPVRIVERARENLRRFAAEEPAIFPLSADRLYEATDAQVQIGKMQAWTWRAAVLLDEAFPATERSGVPIPLAGTSGKPIALRGRNPASFPSRGESGIVLYQTLKLLLRDLDPSGVLQSSMADSDDADSPRYLLFRWDYDAARVKPGDLGLAAEGPFRLPPSQNYALACPVQDHWGAAYALRRCLDCWQLPIQIDSVRDLGPGVLISADLPGSFQYRFPSLARLNVLDSVTPSGPRIAVDVVVSASGIFRFVIARPSLDSSVESLDLRLLKTPHAAAPAVSVSASPAGDPTAWTSIEPLIPLAAEVRDAVALLASRAWSRIFGARLMKAVRAPLVQCQLDFAAQPEASATILRQALNGVFDSSALQLEGDLRSVASEGISVDLHLLDRTASIVEPNLGGAIIVRKPSATRSESNARILSQRPYKPANRPLQTTWPAVFLNPAEFFVNFHFERLTKRFLSPAAASATRVGSLLEAVPPEGAKLAFTVDLFWPNGVESTWSSLSPSQAPDLNARLDAELRFWTPLFALSDPAQLGTFSFVSAYLVYGALPPRFDPRTSSIGESFDVLSNLGQALTGLVNAGKQGFSVPACIEEAERSKVFQKLLGFEDRVHAIIEALARGEQPSGILDLLEFVGDTFGPRGECMQTILLGGGAVQLSANPDLIPGAAIRLNLLRREAVLHSADDPLPPDPPLSHLLAQLSLQDLQDALKPLRVAAALKKSEGAMGASGA
jgi:hypothetical protein